MQPQAVNFEPRNKVLDDRGVCQLLLAYGLGASTLTLAQGRQGLQLT